ncbi:hypothetical protein GTW69_40280 [Streptomyces sp. SID7760]|nr:hypothetical protein [Streptomyces sp. SID7760]
MRIANVSRQFKERVVAGIGGTDSSHAFTRLNGAPIEKSTLARHFNILFRQARLHLPDPNPRIRPYSASGARRRTPRHQRNLQPPFTASS